MVQESRAAVEGTTGGAASWREGSEAPASGKPAIDRLGAEGSCVGAMGRREGMGRAISRVYSKTPVAEGELKAGQLRPERETEVGWHGSQPSHPGQPGWREKKAVGESKSG